VHVVLMRVGEKQGCLDVNVISLLGTHVPALADWG